MSGNSNVDPMTVTSFGDEWSRYRQDKLTSQERKLLFDRYFHIFPWESLPANPEGFDMGCGSGRWAFLVAPMVSILNCIEPSRAYDVAKANLSAHKNVRFFNQSVETCSLPLGSQDFGYCLGALHHIPDTQAALDKTVKLLKPGAP